MRCIDLVELIGRDQTLLAICLSGGVKDLANLPKSDSFFKLVLSVHPGPDVFDPDLPIQRLVLYAWRHFYNKRVSLMSWLIEITKFASTQSPEFLKRVAVQLINGFPNERLPEVYRHLVQTARCRQYTPATEEEELAELVFGAMLDGINDEVELAGVLNKVRIDSYVRLEVLRRLGNGINDFSFLHINQC